MKKIILLIIIIVAIVAAFGAYQVWYLQKAHSTFENYYAFRGCQKLIEKKDSYGLCQLASGQVIKLDKYGNKWFLDGDLPAGAQLPPAQEINYINTQYGFALDLPASWQNYSVINSQWQADGATSSTESGPIISIRNPKWTEQNPYQDIPIMVFTSQQWNALLSGQFHVGAAPVNPSELGQNQNYVFALPARYNYAFPAGYQEVEQILQNNPLHAF